jgi:cell cycle protein kinase DBF2
MATNTPLSPGRAPQELKLPMPPPLLHTKSGNELDRPSTPRLNAFTTPVQTPQGSPSKTQLPPGAKELSNIFDNAMRLDPGTPTKAGRSQLGNGSPNKLKHSEEEDTMLAPGSPGKRKGQENTSPTGRLGKETAYANPPAYAAVSRQEQYEGSTKMRQNPAQALSPEDHEKLNSPKIRRLANVTQICKKAVII